MNRLLVVGICLAGLSLAGYFLFLLDAARVSWATYEFRSRLFEDNIAVCNLSCTSEEAKSAMDQAASLLQIDPRILTHVDQYGATPLHHTACHGQKSVVEFILVNRADINARDKYGLTPLHYAAGNFCVVPNSKNDMAGQADVVKLLLTSNADVNAKTTDGKTPLHFAAFSYNLKAEKLLLSARADIGARDAYGYTPLHRASASAGYSDMVSLLLANNSDINAKSANGLTPLHVAAAVAWGSHTDVVNTLLMNGADVNAKDGVGLTPFVYAEGRIPPSAVAIGVEIHTVPQEEVMDLLRRNGGHE